MVSALLHRRTWTPRNLAGLQLWLAADRIPSLNDGGAIGTWPDLSAAVETVQPAERIEPHGTLDRARFADASRRGAAWIPELTSLDL